MTWGHRYGLIAQNGAGKTTLLKILATRQVPIPDFIDIWYLDKEADPSDRTAIDSVIDTVRSEKDRLEALEEQIMTDVGPEDPRLEAIYEKLEKSARRPRPLDAAHANGPLAVTPAPR